MSSLRPLAPQEFDSQPELKTVHAYTEPPADPPSFVAPYQCWIRATKDGPMVSFLTLTPTGAGKTKPLTSITAAQAFSALNDKDRDPHGILIAMAFGEIARLQDKVAALEKASTTTRIATAGRKKRKI